MPAFLKSLFSLALPSILITATFLLGGCGEERPKQPTLLVSIPPLALMARDLSGDAFVIEVLLSANADPHAYSLRSSDMKKLGAADAIFWLGPQFERFLEKPLQKTKARKLTLVDLLEAHEEFEAHKGHAEHYEEHTHEQHGRLDGHIWLNPEHAIQMAQSMVLEMIALQPAKKNEFEARLQGFTASMNDYVKQTEKHFADYRQSGFIVHHDAYGHYVEAFKLNQLASVNLMPEEQLSAKKRMELEQLSSAAQCMVAESTSPKIQKLAESLQLPLVVIDPLARLGSENLSSEGYFLEFLISIRRSFLQCFSA